MANNWNLLNDHLEKNFEFKSFLKNMSFINAVAYSILLTHLL